MPCGSPQRERKAPAMKRFSSAISPAAAALAAAALLTGCNAGGSQNLPAANGAPAMARSNAHPDRGRSWMARGAATGDLLYVADAQTYDVYVYSYPKGKLVGTLTGLNDPTGVCSDKTGDVWVANEGASNLVEYTHGGTSPIATLNDPGQEPRSCSVNLRTGKLAVTNIFTTSFTQGSVAIYAHAQGSPKIYSDPNLYEANYLGYDDHGNLFVDGFNPSFAFAFAELPARASALKDIALSQSIGFAGGVQWDGKYVAVGDQDTNTIYQVAGASGTVVGSTPLTGGDDVEQFYKLGRKVVGPNAAAGTVGFWNYPAGGSPTKTITGLTNPVAVAVSKAPAP